MAPISEAFSMNYKQQINKNNHICPSSLTEIKIESLFTVSNTCELIMTSSIAIKQWKLLW